MISGARLRQVREARGISQTRLAELAGIPQPFISQIESDARFADPAMHRKIADALGVPSAFLTKTPISLPEGSLGLFRSLSSKVHAPDYHSARRKAEFGVEAVYRLAEGVKLPECRIETLADATAGEVGPLARAMLRLAPDVPIPNLTRALERAGVIVLALSDLHDEVLGFSAWAGEPVGRPMIAVSSRLSAFRLRWTLAHELGHLILGHQVFGRPTRDTEGEANAFASEFLLPEEVMHDVFSSPIDLQRLAEIKGTWGVSMMAILLRAKGLGYVDEGRFRSLYEVMRRKGWLRKEPGDDRTAPERPRLIHDLAAAHGIKDPSELVFKLDYSLQDVRIFFGGCDLDLPASSERG